MMQMMSLFFCAGCAALYEEVDPRCKLCGSRVVPTTERLVSRSGYTVAQMLAATREYVEPWRVQTG